MADSKTLNVIVRNTEEIVFQGEVERVSSFNEVGRFDVFPMHANFISIIQQELSIFHNKQKIKELKIDQAIMKVKGNIVHIFLGVESLFFEEHIDEHTIKPKTIKK
jgi:F0F1-type ATP synthase epsilon subunit